MSSSNSSPQPSEDSELPIPPLNPSQARPSTQADRTRRQAGLFFGGAAFAVFSALITRRALARRYKQIAASAQAAQAAPPPAKPSTNVLSKGVPRSSEAQGYSPASKEVPTQSGTAPNASAEAGAADSAASLQNSGTFMALEALTLATLNVFSFAVMTTGGLLWAFDIGNMEDLRRKVRGGIGFDGTGRTEKEAEEEVEEWIVDVLARKERKDLIRERVAKEMGQDPSQQGNWKNERGKER